MSIIGEAALSSLFGVLFDRLASSDLLKIFQQEQVYADLNKWKKTLLKIHAVLDDAEEKRETSKLVKIWLDDLVDLAYDADDILDEFATEVLRRELNPEPHKSKVRKIFYDWVGSNQSFARLMQSKIAEIDSRLQRIVTEKNDLDLRGSTGGRTGTERSRVPTTSLVKEDHTYGRDEDKKTIIKLLLTSESSDAQLSVIPIIGMGGLGKTTLAQLVYNNDDVNCYFDMKAWACVSENFEIVRVTKAILESITDENCNINDLDKIQVKLKDKLYGKKFLLILDDVWNKDYDDWTKLRCPFEFGAPGSTIIVTTRDHGVSTMMGTTQPYHLKELSNDACWSLFIQHARGSTDSVAHPELEEIASEILDKCKGSPLAAKVLGGALRTKRNSKELKNVLNSKIWEKNGIIPVLELSYQYLPSHLKRCFAYCSLFPKDYAFEENELVLLWMAEGLVQETERNKSMEDLGVEYFHDLLMRSFFQQSSYNESFFVMHDLINDLAEWAARCLCYRMEDTFRSNEQSAKVRHFSYIRCWIDGNKKFENFPKNMHLRTFLPLAIKSSSYLTNYIPNSLLPQLRCLRVLSLCGYKIIELPSSISDLKHLRYLNLSNTSIRSLPESTSSLYNLQTLMLKDCCSLVSFPDGGFLPTHLTNLLIWRCEKLEALPRMHMVTTLRIFDRPSIVSLPEEGLPTNLKELWLGGMTICKQVFEWGLHRLTSLTKLTICGYGFEDWQSFPKEADGKMMLLLPTSLTSLSIIDFTDIVFLSSKVFQNLSVLEELWIWNCPKLASLPENGLPPSLLELRIDECPVLKQHCKKGKGQEWLKNIINIPCVQIHDRSIYELQEEEQQ